MQSHIPSVPPSKAKGPTRGSQQDTAAERLKDLKSARATHPTTGRNTSTQFQPAPPHININLQGNLKIENRIVIVAPTKEPALQVSKGVRSHEKHWNVQSHAGMSDGKSHPLEVKLGRECPEDADIEGQEGEGMPSCSMPSHSADMKKAYFAKKK